MKSRKPRIRLLAVLCRRGCGKEIVTTSRSIHGADTLHRKYSGICSDCITEAEREEMLFGVGAVIVNSARKG